MVNVQMRYENCFDFSDDVYSGFTVESVDLAIGSFATIKKNAVVTPEIFF